IDKITLESESFNNITPEFRFDNGLWVEFKFNQADVLAIKTSGGMSEETSGKASGKASVKTSGKTDVRILQLIAKNKLITIPEMSDDIGVTQRSIERNLQKLQKSNQLKRVDGKKGGYWEIVKGK
ncbi:MAG: HTH domain-containing protein, partial [Proteobacteria bacterium]|nr:HTH domain-containing protein [Pseudomonadota bacterium]